MASNPGLIIRKIFPTAHRILTEKIIRKELPSLSGRILLVGAGHNPYASLMSTNADVLVTDVSDEYGEIDQVVDAHALPFQSNSFDVIIAIEVFEHLKCPEDAASEFKRVLVNGGKVILTMPFMFHIHGDPYDFQRLTSTGLSTLFRAYGAVEINEIGGRLAVISDILTTVGGLFTKPFRILNNLFRLNLFSGVSADCPSGYWVVAIK